MADPRFIEGVHAVSSPEGHEESWAWRDDVGEPFMRLLYIHIDILNCTLYRETFRLPLVPPLPRIALLILTIRRLLLLELDHIRLFPFTFLNTAIR